jgi:hypothetical protein
MSSLQHGFRRFRCWARDGYDGDESAESAVPHIVLNPGGINENGVSGAAAISDYIEYV